MNNTHILDQAMLFGTAPYGRTGAGKRKSAVTALLERLGICRSPRIVSAVCIAVEASASPVQP